MQFRSAVLLCALLYLPVVVSFSLQSRLARSRFREINTANFHRIVLHESAVDSDEGFSSDGINGEVERELTLDFVVEKVIYC